MIKHTTEEAASLYVLDLLTGEERADFELQLKDSAELRRLVRELGTGLHEPIKRVEGPVRNDLLEGIIQRTKPEMSGSATRPMHPVPMPWTYIWAAAALILLAMNLMLLFLVREGAAVKADELLAAGGMLEEESVGMSGEGVLDAEQRTLLEARIASLEQALAQNAELVSRYEDELERAAGENEAVREYNSEWQHEYARLAARILPFFEPSDGMGRFTVIEMVDNEVFLNDLPRRGFADLAGLYLSGEGNIAGVGTTEFVGPVVEGAGIASAIKEPGLGEFAPVSGGAIPMPESTAAPDPVSGPPVAKVDDPTGQATGFTVWRDDEQKGFLDLYNLPELEEGKEAYLWVRASELDPYLPVGIIPNLDNGTGSLFYSVDEPNFTPTEILITAEPVGMEGPEPGETVILRGP
jgi:anti-sigma-K factor RskA